MNKFELPMGKNGGKIQFEITADDQLVINAVEKGETCKLTFMDCIFANKFSHDPHMHKKADCCNAFTRKSDVLITGNKVLFKTIPVSQKTGKEVSEIIEYNLFTVSENFSSVKLETYFEQNGGKLYDCSFFNGRAKFDKDYFDTLYIPSKDASFPINMLTSPVADSESLVLKGNNRYLKVSGGSVEFAGGSIDAHIDSQRYNDDLTHYDKNNPLISYFHFDETEYPTEKAFNTEKSVSDCKTISLNAGKMNALLALDENTLSIVCDEKKYPLCAMRLKNINTNEEIFTDTLSFWENVSSEQYGEKFIFTLTGCKYGNITLKLTAEVSCEKNLIEWTTEVINNSQEYSLVWCTYPRLYVKKERKCDLFEPCYGGSTIKDFSSRCRYTGGTYPSGFWYTMPYLTLYEDSDNPTDSIYFSVHDESGALKEFYATSDNRNIVRFNSRYYAENMYQPKNSNILPGKAIWKAYDGNWFEATDIYRDFVNTHCEWADEKTDKNTPEWMKDIPFWIMDWVPYDKDSTEILPTALRCDEDIIGDNDWYENAIKIKNEFGTPIGYHVYNWHQIPFNNDYPHFVPARERFLNGYKQLKENGIRVMPYINAILWDTKDKGCEDYMFGAVGKKGAVKNSDGEVETLSFESRESNGELVKLAPMCPSKDIWKNTLINLTVEMFEKYDFDAIYLDQIAARVPHLCMDKEHGHPLGGGNWWQKGYNDIVKALNAHKPADKGFSTESNAEVYTKNINAFLSWRWDFAKDEVPAFMRIYSDKVVVFGRNTNGKLKNDAMYWKYNISAEFVYGQQLGWINSDVAKNEKHLQFLKQLVKFRYENREFFRKFNVLRPPVIIKTKDNIVQDKECRNSTVVCGKPYLVAGVLSNSEKKMMLIVNISDKDTTSDIWWKADEYDFSQSEFKIYGNGKVIKSDAGIATITVEKESFMCIEW